MSTPGGPRDVSVTLAGFTRRLEVNRFSLPKKLSRFDFDVTVSVLRLVSPIFFYFAIQISTRPTKNVLDSELVLHTLTVIVETVTFKRDSDKSLPDVIFSHGPRVPLTPGICRGIVV